jgi:RNase P/RNase MRP subunit p30
MAKIAKKNKIKIGISLDDIINSKLKERILARMKQIIMLCNKNKITPIIIQIKNKKNDKDIASLLITLGLHTSLVK